MSTLLRTDDSSATTARRENILHVLVIIDGYDLPGRSFCSPDGSSCTNVHVGIQIRQQPMELVRGDADTAHWALDIEASMTADGALDFRGPAVHGKRGDRFLYLTWGDVDTQGAFAMFRRAKLMLNRIDPDLITAANGAGQSIHARVQLRDDRGMPRCARVDPPAIAWTVE